MSEPVSFYEAVGGEEFFTRLVHRFYQGVADDPALRAVYPAKDLGPAEEHLRLFLMQYWGGPRTYDELRGHPRLRMRHVKFAIGETEMGGGDFVGRGRPVTYNPRLNTTFVHADDGTPINGAALVRLWSENADRDPKARVTALAS